MRGDLIRRNFADRLQREIARRNWNQSDLAREATKHLPKGKLSRDSVSNYMNAKALPGPGFLLAMSKALGTSPEELLPDRGALAAPDPAGNQPMGLIDLGGGYALLRINRRVRFNTAVKILELLADDIVADTQE